MPDGEWFDAITESWRKIAAMEGDPLGLTGQWLDMMESARARMLEDGTFPADPFTFFKQWYDATSETWAKVVGDIIGTEKFIETSSRFLECYASFAMALRRANEEYLRNLQLPTRSDIARVAELVVALEEKVDRIDDTFEDFEGSYAHAATSSSVAALEKRLDRLEGKLDEVLVALAKANAKARPEPARPASTARRQAQKKNAQEVRGVDPE